jgi:methylthioribose-1-phosphate isomerase
VLTVAVIVTPARLITGIITERSVAQASREDWRRCLDSR